MSAQLAGKTTVITGGASGIGLAIARRFIMAGARVIITGRRQSALDAAVADLGDAAFGVRCDSSDLSDLDRLYDVVGARAGRIDVLVLNAAAAATATLGDITEEHFDELFATNVKGVVFGLQKAMPLLSPGASVIVIGSTNSVRPDPGLEVYSATKAALRNFARSWTRNSRTNGFRVNVLSPGPTLTPALLGLTAEAEQPALVQRFADAVPLGRIGQPSEIAEAALLLASDDATYVNGAEWFIDGGYAQV